MIPVNTPWLDGNEKKYLAQCVDTGWISSEGPFVTQFEQAMADYVGRKHAIAVTNGTTALEAAVAALDLPRGSEVILPSFTIISCAAAIVRAGLTPICVDCDPVSWNMTPIAVEAAITDKTSAIMIVHIYGLPCEMDALTALAEAHGLAVIEDAAEMIGQTYHKQACGSFGAISTFSFYPNKHITTGEGGMVLTDDDGLAKRVKSLRNLCFQPHRRFVHEELGYNLRMTNIQAALGLAQLEQIDKFLQKKRHIGALYNDHFKDLHGVQLPLAKSDFADNIYWVYGLVLDEQDGRKAVDIMRVLGEKKIGTRPFFYPMNKQPALHKLGFCKNNKCPEAERLSEFGFYVPSGLGLSDDEIAIVADEVKKILA